jgi:methylphosphotriester-DNA--protein-cysteine methyltransferase
MPYCASANARHAGWRAPKRCKSRFNGNASVSVASII